MQTPRQTQRISTPHNSKINVLNTYQTLSSSCWQKPFKAGPWLVYHLFYCPARPLCTPSLLTNGCGARKKSPPSLTWCIFLLLLVDYTEPVLKDWGAMINLKKMEVFWRTKMIPRAWGKRELENGEGSRKSGGGRFQLLSEYPTTWTEQPNDEEVKKCLQCSGFCLRV